LSFTKLQDKFRNRKSKKEKFMRNCFNNIKHGHRDGDCRKCDIQPQCCRYERQGRLKIED